MPFQTDVVRAFFDSHWTVRKYKHFQMPADHLDVILAAAQRAPTDATAQMYSFIRITDPALRKSIATLSGNPQVESASEAFLVCADIHRLEKLLELESISLGKFPRIAIHFSIGDAALAGQNLLLAAEMLGYRGCWIGGVINALDEISQLVKLPRGVLPYAALTIGLPDEPAVHRPRLPRTHIVHENCYTTPNEAELRLGADKMGEISSRGNWVQTLARYFGKQGNMEAREECMRAYIERFFMNR